MHKLYILIFLLSAQFLSAQILNAYAKANGISGTTLSVINVNEASHTFTVGGKVIIMQMQDDVIGSNTVDASTFGDLSGISNAGIYEIGVISSRSPATGTPTTITLSSALVNTYNIGVNTSVQIISFRNMGINFTTTGNITGLIWNGLVGGVIAFEVSNSLTLNHSVSADVIGFRKGLINSNAVAGACLPTIFRTNSVNQAFKGEGIYKPIDPNFANARGKIINGGGGGNEHNGGGGGGGNYTAGGAGGFGYSCGPAASANNSGGLGGISLSTFITGGRVFMGGGGGGGQQNNTVGLDGGSGGGIILIKATTLVTNTICGSAIKISANGGSTASCGNDGAGGGGAAGSIVLQITNYTASAACPIAINANGGNGGNVSDGTEHGGGGGGGQGVVVFSTSQPTVNVTSTTTNGTGGQNNSGPTSFAGNGGGVSNTGILTIGGPLPVELLLFDGEQQGQTVKVFWSTATETNTEHFIVEKSPDGVDFLPIGKVKASGVSNSIKNYQLYDEKPLAINYYRLQQTDTDGRIYYSQIIRIETEMEFAYSIFPNPLNGDDDLKISLGKTNLATLTITIYDITGKQIVNRSVTATDENVITLNLRNVGLSKGIYMVRFFTGSVSKTQKLVVE